MSGDVLTRFQHSEDQTCGFQVLESPYCKVVIKGCADTVVCFSAINCAPGKFFGSKALAGLDANLVFLNCPSNSWYLDGVPALGGSLEESARSLLELMEAVGIGGGRKLFWGGSMGGYGAAAMGALVNADMVVATGAELDLFIQGGNSELILKRIQGRTNMRKPDLESLFSDCSTRFFLYCGEFAYHDISSLALLQSHPFAEFRTLRDFGHPLPGYIQSTYGLKEFIAHHWENACAFPFKKDEIGTLWQFPGWWRDLHLTANDAWEESVSRVKEGISDPSWPAALRSHMAHCLSLMESSRGDSQAALSWSRKALELCEFHSNFLLYRHACALRDSGASFSEWLKVADRIQPLEDPARLEFGDKLIRMMHDGIAEWQGTKQAEKFVHGLIKKTTTSEKRTAFLRSLLHLADDSDHIWLVDIAQEAAGLATRSRIDRQTIPPDNPLLLSGFMFFLRDDDRIVSVHADGADASVLSQELNLESPGVAKLHPETPWSGHCRFRLRLQINEPGITTIILKARTAGGLLLNWLELRRQMARDPRNLSA